MQEKNKVQFIQADFDREAWTYSSFLERRRKVHNATFISLLLKYHTQAETYGFCEIACVSTVVYHLVCLNTKYYH